jgi:hypothetical protein
MVADGGAACLGIGRAGTGMLGAPGPGETCPVETCPVETCPAGPAAGREAGASGELRASCEIRASGAALGNGWRGPERICPGLGAGGEGRAGIGIPRGAIGGANGCPDESGGRSGADRGAGGASTGTSRAGCEASTTGSCLGADGARDGSAAGLGSARSTVSVSGDAARGDPFDSPVSRRLTSIATGSSIELEWVFFSATPSSGSMSRITFGFTSSSRASSLIRILTILCAPPSNSDTGVVRLNPAPFPEPPRLPGTPQFLS